jgi:hypothetical protein
VAISIPAANDEWTSTGISVSANDIVLIRAGGRVKVGQMAGEVGPNGAFNSRHGPGLLLAKIGTTVMVPVGDQAFIVAAQGGLLRFKVQDTRYDDNQGAFTVDVIVIPAALIPPRREN